MPWAASARIGLNDEKLPGLWLVLSRL
ncbi:hypothetical protein XFF7766_1020003 [Xanthomonas citri pv. fuscans]|nr:hypothetical protein XFF6960_640005 [Xanthomonas citri pv. fuscans]SOO12203.1 hypothetical protein XFF7766_1020003 [Xanthomonas citri pv. fuscans]